MGQQAFDRQDQMYLESRHYFDGHSPIIVKERPIGRRLKANF